MARVRRIPPAFALIVPVLLLVALGTTETTRPAYRYSYGGHPERPADVDRASAQQAARRAAPFASVATGAYSHAVAQRAALAAPAGALAGSGGMWKPAGKAPLIGDDQTYTRTSGVGFGDLSGRVNGFAHDAAHGRLFAAVGAGGVWESADLGAGWRPIGDNLPTSSIGSVAYTPAEGGAIVVSTGDDVFGGGGTFAGVGVWRTTDDGRTWTRADGPPSGVISFKVAVDPTDPFVVYAATGAGLFRSSDAGRRFVNVDLPTDGGVPAGQPHCQGAAPTVEGCFLANMVTDVVVQSPDSFGHAGGAVVAAVGWRAGTKTNTSQSYPGGYLESPNNGIFTSSSGRDGTFTKVDTAASNFADGEPAKIGRVELGATTGAAQNHNYLYALVQDATPFAGGAEVSGIDVPGGTGAPLPTNTYFKGVYVSPDFGHTWVRMANATQLQDPTSGSALTGVACSVEAYCPGIQSWYNEWVQPDPLVGNAAGVPTRLLFGLEEVWESRLPTPQDGPSSFKVIGAYYGGATCSFFTIGGPTCPTSPGASGNFTTHPDQHGAIYVPDGAGGETLVVGNDGGVYTQHVAAGVDFDNAHWGRGANRDLYTLAAYDARVAKDGTIWSGLQDNGELKIKPDGSQYNTHDGDGGFDAVDPDHSESAFESAPGGSMSHTTDGGATWTDVSPPSDNFMFTLPFTMGLGDPNHLLTAGKQVWETGNAGSNWTSVFDLGANPPADNQVSAVDMRGQPTGAPLPTGAHTGDFTYTAGGDTVPGANLQSTGFSPPGTTDDHGFTIGPNDGDASFTVKVTWDDPTYDWDLFVYRLENGAEVPVGQSATNTPSEQVVVADPKPGSYVIRVANFAATGTFTTNVTFRQRPAGAKALTDAAYVGFCGYCDALNDRPFRNGLATNVGGEKPPKALSSDGWHKAKAAGLPNRYVTSVQIDPIDGRTVYVTLGGYSRRWLPVGALGEGAVGVGSGHVFTSTDAGDTFTDVSGNLPDIPANWSVARNGQLVVGTDIGVFIAGDTSGGRYQVLGTGLPTVPVYTMQLKPKASDAEPDQLVVATQGRGVWTYTFADAAKSTSRPTVARRRASPATGADPATALLGLAALVRRPRRRPRRPPPPAPVPELWWGVGCGIDEALEETIDYIAVRRLQAAYADVTDARCGPSWTSCSCPTPRS